MSYAGDQHLQVFSSFLLLLLFVIFHSSFLLVWAEEEFNYDDSSPLGPQHWGDLRPEWSTCRDGREQSPVHVNHLQVQPSVQSLDVSYQDQHAILRNTGHNIMVNWTGESGRFVLMDDTYVLQQSHWHTPSEHTFGHDTRYPLEMHTVYKSSTGKIAVFAFVYDLGDKDDAFLSKLVDPLKQMAEENVEEVDLGTIHPDEITRSSTYFRYQGSLTTPPCTEGVVWTIMQEVKTISSQQLKVLTDASKNKQNARPAQPINGREIQMFKQS